MFFEYAIDSFHLEAEVGGKVFGQLELYIFYSFCCILAVIYDLCNTLGDLGGATGQDRGRRSQMSVSGRQVSDQTRPS